MLRIFIHLKYLPHALLCLSFFGLDSFTDKVVGPASAKPAPTFSESRAHVVSSSSGANRQEVAPIPTRFMTQLTVSLHGSDQSEKLNPKICDLTHNPQMSCTIGYGNNGEPLQLIRNTGDSMKAYIVAPGYIDRIRAEGIDWKMLSTGVKFHLGILEHRRDYLLVAEPIK